MSDPMTQLRAYFDQTVERIDVEDVLARSRVRNPRRPRPFLHKRPAWIATAAALIMVVSIGAVAAGAWLLRGEIPGDFAIGPAANPPTGGDWSGVLILGIAIGGSTIALLATGTTISNAIRRMRDRRNTMQTIENPELELTRLREANARLGSAKRSLIAALVVVLIAVAAAGAWLIIDNAGPAVERDIAALIDDYFAAWESGDHQAVVALMTDDATLIANNGSTYTGSDSIGAFVATMQGFHPEQIGNPMILAPTAPRFEGWFVAAHTLAPNFPAYGDIRELELFTVVEEGGQYLIEMHETWMAGR